MQKMSTQASLADRQITGEDLLMLSLEELETLLLQMYPALEKIFQAIGGYSQETRQVEAQFQKVIGLENYFKTVWEELKATVDAIITRAVFAEFNEREWHKLARGVQKENAFMQAVTSGKDINAEWLVQRDALVAQMASLLKDVSLEDADQSLMGEYRLEAV
jgi:hypothetical protein